MATDATGTPTTLGIPTFTVGVDAPTGNGSNAQMEVIDSLIQGRIAAPSGIASGEVPVWNGSAWVRSSATNIAPTSLGSGSPDSTKFLRGDGTWAVPSTPAGVLKDSASANAPALTNSGSVTTLATGNAVTYAATPHLILAKVAGVTNNGNAINVYIYEDGSQLEVAAYSLSTSASDTNPMSGWQIRTPSPGTHTYSVRASASGGGGNPTVNFVTLAVITLA